MFDSVYMSQARLMLRCIPEISKYDFLSLKGGTAINFFIRALPRLSIDIDLTYILLDSRQSALGNIDLAIRGVAHGCRQRIPGARIDLKVTEGMANRLSISSDNATIKIEINTVLRGSVFPSERRDLCDVAQNHFELYTSISCMSFPDLFAGKICAALDRQHPRDYFDVMLLLENEGISDKLRQAFVAYLISSPRPIHELLAPHIIDIRETFHNQFSGMERLRIPLNMLLEIQQTLPEVMRDLLTDNDKLFLVSVMEEKPQWDLMEIDHLQRLPAVRWKLYNIQKISPEKRHESLIHLKKVLEM